jgi:RimJ/RimL family protein N-acetyltransferase
VTPPEITFRALAEGDLPLVHRWLNNPAVAEWYGLDLENKTYPSYEEVAANYLPRIRGETRTFGYIAAINGNEAAYIQCYRIGDHPAYAAALGDDDDAWGIDMFIGEDACRGRGLGALLLAEFVEKEVLLRPGLTGVVIAPNPRNRRAIRCYEKAGFRYLRTVWVPQEDEEEFLMVRDAP